MDVMKTMKSISSGQPRQGPCKSPPQTHLQLIEMDGKVQNTSSTPSAATAFCVRLVKGYTSPEAIVLAAQRLSEILRRDLTAILPLFQRDRVVIKRNLPETEARRWQKTLSKAGILCEIQEIPPPTPAPSARTAAAETNQIRHTAPRQSPEQATPARTNDAGVIRQDMDDENDEEIWEAPFVLSEKLTHGSPDFSDSAPSDYKVQVIKTIGDCVVDSALLSRGRKYRIDTEQGRFCLARHSSGKPVAYLKPAFDGYVTNRRGEVMADLDSYKSETYRHSKRKAIYAIPLSEGIVVVVNDAGCRYCVSLAPSFSSPEIVVAKAPATFSWRHWAGSAGVHLIFLLCLSIYLYFQASTPDIPEPHFVKIDAAVLEKLEARKPPEPVKKEPPPPKAEPEPPVKKKTPPKKVKPRPATAKSRKKTANRPEVAKTTRHPNAGGGFGKGNIKNRNINQTGILSVLGNTKLSGPSEAMAAVTNLDAVPVPGATGKNFTVGGLKGSLGNGKISVATGEIVQTKGTRQVLRSAGAGGMGEIAALEKGTTGKKHVQAMVSAKLSRTVKIEGGMSREMVKRVIDQHLEEITYCYETALMENPSILGRIVFEWKILMNGRVGEIRIVASSVNSHEIHDCIKSAIKSWQFPKPTGAEVVVSYPFVFDLVAF